MIPLSLILATDIAGAIGLNNDLPWPRIKADMKFFRDTTADCPVIMGRKTFESLPGVLKGRLMIVVTSDPKSIPSKADGDSNAIVIKTSLQEAIDHAMLYADMEGKKEVFVIGGARMFAEALPLADRVYWTAIQSEFPGDVYFSVPNNLATHWKEFKAGLVKTEHTDGGMRLDFWLLDRLTNVDRKTSPIRFLQDKGLAIMAGDTEAFDPLKVSRVQTHSYDGGTQFSLSVKLDNGDTIRSSKISNHSSEALLALASELIARAKKG